MPATPTSDLGGPPLAPAPPPSGAEPATPVPATKGPGWGWSKIITLVLAFGFLVGAAGYAIGTIESKPASSEVDIGFLQDMITHHDQAVEMSLMAYDQATDPVVRGFAKEVLVFQRREIGLMEAYLAERGHERGDRSETAMGWMGMPVPVTSMPGLATADEMDELGQLEGTEFDVAFLELMRAHHVGGLHMAEYAGQNAAARQVRDLAAYIAKNQPVEVNEYDVTIERLEAEAAAG